MTAAVNEMGKTAEERLHALLPGIRGLLYRLCWSSSELDDLTQEVLIEVARALPRFEGRAQLTTYAHTIAVRTAYRWLENRRRSRGREVSLEVVPEPVESLDPESRAMARAALRRLYRVLDGLSPDLRMAFLMCDVHGLSAVEAAAIEQITDGTMRARLFRARRLVRRELAGDPYLARLLEGSGR